MPNIHPLLVHFPVALLTFAFLAEVAALLSSDTRFSFVGWWAQLSGTAMIAAAVISGLIAAQNGTVSQEAFAQFATHQEMAFLTSAVFGVLLLWRIGMRTTLHARWRLLYLLLFAVGVMFVLSTAWTGGGLVYRFGTAVG